MANLTQTSLIKSAVYAHPGEGNIGETGLHTRRENTYQVSIKQPDFPLKNTTSHPNHLQFRERKKKTIWIKELNMQIEKQTQGT